VPAKELPAGVGEAINMFLKNCWYVAGGKCVQIPGQDMLPPKLRVPSYPVVERGHFIWVWMGDLARADASLIVDLPYLHDPQWKGMPARLHYDANYLPPFHKKVIRDKTAKADRRNVATMLVPQFMTPETEHTTHFFWSYLNNFEGDYTTISRSLLDSLIEGFMEDKAIIEQQQKTLGEDPRFQMLAIRADAPLAHFRHIPGKLIEAEQVANRVN
jgi:vanillate O-demethylase monooxygenase subunit